MSWFCWTVDPSAAAPSRPFSTNMECDALEKSKAKGITRTLVGLESVDRGIPRDGYKVRDLDGNEIGYVTSGSYAPFLKKNIALAYVPVGHSEVGHEVAVEIRNQPVKCKVIPTPFYKRPKKQS